MINKIIYYLSTIKTRTWVLICFLAILISPFLFSIEHTYYPFVLGEKSSWVGDAIGGITAPIIGFFSIILLYRTLNEQLKFNERQYEFNKRQDEFNTSQLEFAKVQKEFAFDEQFKSTLFSLLETQRILSNSVSGTFVTLNTDTISEDYTISEQTGSKVLIGKEFFERAKTELMSIFAVLELDIYYQKYCPSDLEIIIRSFNDTVNKSENSSTEKQHDNQRMMQRIRNIKNKKYYAYVNDKFHVTRDHFNIFKNLNQNQKNACGFYFFYSKYLQIGEYYRHLYHILKFIEQTEQSEMKTSNSDEERTKIKDKYMEYAQLIQSQMSYDEMLFLYYDSFLFPKLKDLLIKYKLLENLYIENLISKKHNEGTGYNLKNKNSLFQYIIDNP